MAHHPGTVRACFSLRLRRPSLRPHRLPATPFAPPQTLHYGTCGSFSSRMMQPHAGPTPCRYSYLRRPIRLWPGPALYAGRHGTSSSHRKTRKSRCHARAQSWRQHRIRTPIIPPKEHPMATLSVSITYSNYRMNENDLTVTATITFNQPIRPDSFNLGSLYNIEGYRARFTPSNLTAVAGSNNTQWTVTLTPDAGIDGQYGKISLWLGSIRDANGNLGPGSHGQSGDVMVDNVKPRLVSAVFADSTLSIGETTTVTLTFSENVRDYGIVWLTSKSIDMSGSNCTLVSIEPADGGYGAKTARIYILTIRPNENVQSSSNNVIRVKHDQMGDEANNRPAADTNLSSGTFTVDTKRPTLEAATVTGDQLVLRYDEALNGDAARKPAATAFSVTGSSGEAITVTGVGVDAATRTVTLALSRAAKNGETVTVNYTAPAVNHGNSNDAIQDAAGNDAVGLTNQAVTNATPPLCSGATVNGNQLVLSFADAGGLDGAAAPATTAFSLSGNITVTAVVVNATAKTVTLTLSRPAAYGEQVSITYTDPAGNQTTGVIQDTAGNDVATFTQQTVVNKTPPV
ncbi:hypothetical protein ET532_010625, partial [Verminephrobacter sp. Larva24]